MNYAFKVIEEMGKRLERAKQLARGGKVRKVEGAEAWVVENGDGSKLYLVQNGSCTCQDFQQRKELHKGWCKHRLAVELMKNSSQGREKDGAVQRD